MEVARLDGDAKEAPGPEEMRLADELVEARGRIRSASGAASRRPSRAACSNSSTPSAPCHPARRRPAWIPRGRLSRTRGPRDVALRLRMPQTPGVTKDQTGRAAARTGVTRRRCGATPGGGADRGGRCAAPRPGGRAPGIRAVGDEGRAARVGRGPVDPRVPDHPDAALGEGGLEKPEPRGIRLEGRLVARHQDREESAEPAARQGPARDRSRVVGPEREGVARGSELVEGLERARLWLGVFDGILLVRRTEPPTRLAEGRPVGGGRLDDLADRPGAGGLGQREPLGLHQRADLALQPDQVERRAHQGVVQVEGAERTHGTQYSASRAPDSENAGGFLLG